MAGPLGWGVLPGGLRAGGSVGADRADWHRWTRTPEETFVMTEADLDRWRTQFDVPDAAELEGRVVADPPPGWSSWSERAAERWLSLSDGYAVATGAQRRYIVELSRLPDRALLPRTACVRSARRGSS